jgi:chitinase
MAYDIMGSWSSVTGPNAPFGTPPSPGDPFGFVQAIDSWRNAGWPSEKLVMGTAFYGRSLTATVNMDTQNPISQYVPFSPTVPKGGPSDSQEVNFYCNEGSAWSGQWKWKELRGGPLAAGPISPASGWTRHWDNQTQTPWLFQPSTKTYISYDDVQSLTVKVNYVKSLGLKGVMLWDASYDYNGELINVLNQVRDGVTPTSTASPSATVTTTMAPSTTITVPTTMTMTTTTIPTTTTTPVGPCVGVAAWNSATVYANAGTKVTYGGYLYTNQWWTQNETPSASAWGVWKQGAAC